MVTEPRPVVWGWDGTGYDYKGTILGADKTGLYPDLGGD